MVRYNDNKGKKIQKGFYRYSNSGNLIYFTGKYDEDTKLPIFEKDSEIENTKIFPNHVTIQLCRIYRREIRKTIKELKEKTNWLEKKLEE
jgi:hypothetical protein